MDLKLRFMSQASFWHEFSNLFDQAFVLSYLFIKLDVCISSLCYNLTNFHVTAAKMILHDNVSSCSDFYYTAALSFRLKPDHIDCALFRAHAH